MQASATSKVDDRAARTCFTVKVSTYIAAIQDMQATFTSKAVRTCSDWVLSTFQDLSRLAEVQIFATLIADEQESMIEYIAIAITAAAIIIIGDQDFIIIDSG